MIADGGHGDPEEGRGPGLAVMQGLLPGLAALLTKDGVAAALELHEAVGTTATSGWRAGGSRHGERGHVPLARVALRHGTVVVVPLPWKTKVNHMIGGHANPLARAGSATGRNQAGASCPS